jgi:hypothetical protein
MRAARRRLIYRAHHRFSDTTAEDFATGIARCAAT